jgi:hypothetical protein
MAAPGGGVRRHFPIGDTGRSDYDDLGKRIQPSERERSLGGNYYSHLICRVGHFGVKIEEILSAAGAKRRPLSLNP